MNKELLPIGSVVLLNGGKKNVMVIGYLAIPNENKNVVYDYSACLYPEGVLSSEQTLVFNHEQIENIIFKGYECEEESKFISQIKEYSNKSNDNLVEENKVVNNVVENNNDDNQDIITIDFNNYS